MQKPENIEDRRFYEYTLYNQEEKSNKKSHGII
jgi:hypothetical protein